MSPAAADPDGRALREILRRIADARGDATAPEIDPHADLLLTGVLDSMGFIQLLLALERDFGATLSDDDLARPDVTTAAGLRRLVTDKADPARLP